MSSTENVTRIVRQWRDEVGNMSKTSAIQAGGLVLPDHSASPMRDFARLTDDRTRQIIAEFPDMTPDVWEAFLDLIPNIRKILGLQGIGGVIE